MQNIYIDESGTMTFEHKEEFPYFIISMLQVYDIKKLKRVYKRFVSNHLTELKAADKNNKMFVGDKFKELKGSEFTPELKRDFIKFFNRKDIYSLYIIKVENQKVRASFYYNKNRAFNYIIQIAVKYFIEKGYINDDRIMFQLDERNERTESKCFLEDYLNTQLILENYINHDIKVNYFDSANNCLIQVADVFANIFFSYFITKKYSGDIKSLFYNDVLKMIYRFPLKS